MGLLIALLVYRLLIQNKKNKADTQKKMKYILKLLFISTLSFIVIAVFLNYIGLFEGTRFEVLFSFKQMFSNISFLDRILRYIKAIRLFSSNPFSGVGIGGFSVLDERDYPHNLLLEIGCELGSIGLILWITIVLQTYKKSSNLFIITALFTQSIVYSLFSGDLGYNYEYVLFSFIAITLYNNPIKKKFLNYEKKI